MKKKICILFFLLPLSILPQSIDYLEEGRKAIKAKDYTRASDCLTEYIYKNSFVAEAFLLRGETYYYNKYFLKAVRDLNYCIKLNSNNYSAYNWLAKIDIRYKEYDSALSKLSKSLKIKPNVDAWYWTGRIKYEQNNKFSALQAFEKCIQIDSNYVEAIYYRALLDEYYRKSAFFKLRKLGSKYANAFRHDYLFSE